MRPVYAVHQLVHHLEPLGVLDDGVVFPYGAEEDGLVEGVGHRIGLIQPEGAPGVHRLLAPVEELGLEDHVIQPAFGLDLFPGQVVPGDLTELVPGRLAADKAVDFSRHCWFLLFESQAISV